MKKLLTILLFFLSLNCFSQTRFSDLSLYLAAGDSAKVPVIIPNGSGGWQNRLMYGRDLSRARSDSIVAAFANYATLVQLAGKVAYTDSITKYVTPTQLSSYVSGNSLLMKYADSAAMLLPYLRRSDGIPFWYDSTQFRNFGTGPSPFQLMPTGISAGTYSAPTFTIDIYSRITSISNGPGTVGPFLYLPQQSSAIPAPAAGTNIADSAGITMVRTDLFRRVFDIRTITGNRKWTFPDYNLNVAGTDVNNNFSVPQGIYATGGNQLIVGWDNSSHFVNLSVSSGGSFSIIPNATSQTLFVNSFSTLSAPSLIANGALQTSSSGANANLFVSGSTTVGAGGLSQSTVSLPQLAFAGAATVSFRMLLRGNTSTTLGIGDSYTNLLIGNGSITAAASGVHALFAQGVINPLTTITNSGTATITNTATFYLNGAATTTVTNKNYTAWFNGGIFRSKGGYELDETNVADVAYSILSTDYRIAYTSISLPRAVTLPSAASVSGQHFVIQDESGSVTGTNKITIVGTIQPLGANPDAVTTAYGVFKFYSNGTTYIKE